MSSNLKPASVEGVRDFFQGELVTVLEKRQVHAERSSVEYLAELLVAHMKSDDFFKRGPDGKLEETVLAHLYAEVQQGTPEVRKAALKRLGDICLLVTGLFPDSLKRKLVDVDYYFGMGGSAYAQLADIQFTKMAKQLFGELSAKFVAFSTVLGEITEKGGLQSNTDILRLYERWSMTGSESLKEKLSAQGILVPHKIDTKIKH